MHKLFVSSIAMSAAMLMAAPVIAQGVTTTTDMTVVDTQDAPFVVTAPDGYTMLGFDTVTTEQLTGAPVYDAQGNDVAVIADIVIGADNAISGIVTDVGGFLGMGQHRVLLNPEQVEIYTNADNDTRAYVKLSDDALKALPAYEVN